MIRVGHLAAGAIAGELAMLGISQTRSAARSSKAVRKAWRMMVKEEKAHGKRWRNDRKLWKTCEPRSEYMQLNLVRRGPKCLRHRRKAWKTICPPKNDNQRKMIQEASWLSDAEKTIIETIIKR